MADPTWPMDIGDRPLRENVGYSPKSNMESFQVEDGAGFEVTGPLAAEAPLEMAPTYPMTEAEFARWLVWWRDDTKSGTVPFVLRDPYSREALRWRLQTGQQIGVEKPWPTYVYVRLPLVKVP